MNTKTLVVLAAGLGSRYGGNKQLETVTEEGETIIDFSLYDALASGIERIVFVVRRSIAENVRSEFGPKLKGRAEVAYVHQDEFTVPSPDINRRKPWGTGHAVLAASVAVRENFWVINADDFYGRASFLALASAPTDGFSLVSFHLGQTLSPNGPVSRGECMVDDKGFLLGVVERKGIVSENGIVTCDDPSALLTLETPVSMNLWGFTPAIFGILKDGFDRFLGSAETDPLAEFGIPQAVNRAVSSGSASVKVLNSEERWSGITFKEDKELVARHIVELRERGLYPSRLF